MALSRIKERQLFLSAGLTGFKPGPRSPADDQIEVEGGWYDDVGENVILLQALQASGIFAPVLAGQGRWDLVYLDNTGAVAIEAGVAQVLPVAPYTGAPGVAAPTTAPNMFPIAYVYVDELAGPGVIVDDADITDLRDWFGKLTRAVLGDLASDNPAGAAGVLGTTWSETPSDHQHPPNIGAGVPAAVDVAGQGPGAGFVYARTDHIHQLAAGFVTSVRQPYDKAVTCLWAPVDNTAAANPGVKMWQLHHFQGRADNDLTYYFNLSRGIPELLTLFPVDGGGTGNNIMPGGSDDTDVVAAAVVQTFLYVYIIGVPGTTTYALVYSSNPPNVGPGLTDAAFTGPGYTLWRWVTCIEMSFTAQLPVAMRKIGNIVFKEWYTGTPVAGTNRANHVEDLFWNATAVGAAYSLAEHVSPMAIAAFVNWALKNKGGGTTLEITTVPGTPLGTQDKPDAHGYDYNKLIIVNSEAGDATNKYNNDGFWMPLDSLLQFYAAITIVAAGDVAGVVVAYEEHNLDDVGNVVW